MRKSKYSEEQIIGFIKQVEAGMALKELCRKHGFSDASFYKWRAKFWKGLAKTDAMDWVLSIDLWSFICPRYRNECLHMSTAPRRSN